MKEISESNLKKGQWFKLSFDPHVLARYSGMPDTQKLYEQNRFFWIADQDNVWGDRCRLTVFDIDGAYFDYCARLRIVGGIPRVANDSVVSADISEVIEIHGTEKIRAVYHSAVRHFEGVLTYLFMNHSAIGNYKSTNYIDMTHRHIEYAKKQLQNFALLSQSTLLSQTAKLAASFFSVHEIDNLKLTQNVVSAIRTFQN